MKRRVQMFCSVVVCLGLVVGAGAIENLVWWWDATGMVRVKPVWVHYLAVGVLILGAASPILTWPRPVILRRPPGRA